MSKQDLKNRTYQNPAVPVIKENSLWLQICFFLCCFLQNGDAALSQTTICIVYFDICLRQKSPKCHPKVPKSLFFAVISETEFLQRLVVGKNNYFQFSFLYYVYRGLKGFSNLSFWSYLRNPQKGKILANGFALSSFIFDVQNSLLQGEWRKWSPKRAPPHPNPRNPKRKTKLAKEVLDKEQSKPLTPLNAPPTHKNHSQTPQTKHATKHPN